MRREILPSRRRGRWSVLFVVAGLVVGIACGGNRTSAPGAYKPEETGGSTCGQDSDCPGATSCVKRDDDGKYTCTCQVGLRGATCGLSTDCGVGSGKVCDPATCSCVVPEAGTGTDGGGDDGGGSGAGSCTRECTTDSDCSTPTEDVCVNGKCYNGCKTKGCSNPNMTCVELNGQARCVVTCTTDNDCGGIPCASQADDGTKFCATPCTSDADCADPEGEGYRGPHCVNGTCACKGDSDCSGMMYSPVCGN